MGHSKTANGAPQGSRISPGCPGEASSSPSEAPAQISSDPPRSEAPWPIIKRNANAFRFGSFSPAEAAGGGKKVGGGGGEEEEEEEVEEEEMIRMCLW